MKVEDFLLNLFLNSIKKLGIQLKNKLLEIIKKYCLFFKIYRKEIE